MHCVHGKSGLCRAAGIECYQNGLTRTKENMSLENYKKIVKECIKGGTQQLALGGAGDVDQHENFEEILKYTKDSGIIPNFTTSGLGLTKEKAHICKKYCGAVAVSQYSRLISYEVRRKVQNSDELTENLVFYIGKEDNSTYTTNYFDGYIIINNKQWEVVDTTENKNSEYQYATVYEDINGNQKSENNRKYTVNAITNLLEEGVITNIHYVLGNNSIDEAITRLKHNLFPKGINAVIFLLHKPVGLGTKENVLDVDSPKLKEFFELVDKNQFDFKIGFDSCSIPGIINMTKNISKASIDTCEGSRFSCYIDAQMNMMPCSFDNEQLRWTESLNDKTIEEVWNGERFESFRDSLKNSCTSCKNRNICMGGCPIVPEIVLCNSKDKLLLNEVGPSVFKTIK